MKLYEFEGKRLFDRAGIKTPPGGVVSSAEEAGGLTKQFGPVMAKAQVLRGKRGKRAAIIACENEEQLAAAVGSLLGRKLSDETVEKVLVEQKLDISPRGLRLGDLRGPIAGGDAFGQRRRRRREGLPRRRRTTCWSSRSTSCAVWSPEQAAELARRAGLEAERPTSW